MHKYLVPKFPEDIETKIVQISLDNKELDADDIWVLVTELQGFNEAVTILRAFRSSSKPELFHHDNGGEYDNGVVSRLLRMLDIVDVSTAVGIPRETERRKELIARTGNISRININFKIYRILF